MIEIDDLTIEYNTEVGSLRAVEDVSFTLEENQTLGLVGESGSGKSTLAKSIIRLLDDNGEIIEGSIRFNGEDLTEMGDKALRKKIRWNEISMIPQNAMNGFDPVYTVGDQIIEVIQYHEKNTTKGEAEERAYDLFNKIGIDQERIHDYPHQFSGGMAQRAMIAMALALNPSLILADEPTTALDVITQKKILDLIDALQEEIGVSMLMITHDMSVVAETCDDIGVMYGGRLVEYSDTNTILKDPRHPYTLGLQNSFPDISLDSQELIAIPGTPPNVINPKEECRFAPRCPFALEECKLDTPESRSFGRHKVECVRADENEYLQMEAGDRETWMGKGPSGDKND